MSSHVPHDLNQKDESRMNPKIYHAFRVVMRSGTISAAAEKLGRSQPAVSRMIDKLEEGLGVKLFERRKGRIVPTNASNLLLEEVEKYFHTISSLDNFGQRLEEIQEGTVDIAALPAVGLDFMAEVIARFTTARPQTKVVLNVRMSASVEKLVSSQQVDFGIAETPFQLPGFSTKIFCDSNYLAAVPKDSGLARLEEVRPENLRNEAVIGWSALVSARRIFDDIMQGSGIPVRSKIETTMSSSLCSLTKRGLGMAIVDPFTAWSFREESLVFIPFYPRIPCRFALLHPVNRLPTALASEAVGFAEELRDEVIAATPVCA